jgi:hypothetical protein
MRVGVKRVILTKFHKIMNPLRILNKFKTNSTTILFLSILIQFPFQIRENSNNQSCSSFQILSSNILFQNFQTRKEHFGAKTSLTVLNSIFQICF